MSAKPETTFIGGVHKLFPPGRKNPYWMKNSNLYTSGIPDCWYSGERDLWVEYKFIVLPKRGGTEIKCDLSELQLEWIRERRKEGRDIAVIGCKEGGLILLNGEWEETYTLDQIKDRISSRREIAQWIMGFTRNHL